MKGFLKSILKFVPLAGLIYISLIILWGELIPYPWLKNNLIHQMGTYGFMNSRIKELKTKENIDLLILGASHAYRGIDTREFDEMGIDAFNMGSSAQSPLQTNILLERYLDRLNPDMVLYEVYPGNFTSDGVESTIDIISNDDIDLEIVTLAISQNNLKVYNTLIYGIWSDALNRNDKYHEPLVIEEDVYIPGGFVEREITTYRHLEYSENNWQLNQTQLAAFRENIKMFEERGIKVFLVQAPITEARFQSYNNNSFFDSLFSSFGTYRNFNGGVSLDDSLHFYDSHHLNQNGVNRFNKALIDEFFKSN